MSYTERAETREGAYNAVRNIMLAGLRAGAPRQALNHIEWDISGDCQNARRVERYARPYVIGQPKWVPDTLRDYRIDEKPPERLAQSKYVTISAPTGLSNGTPTSLGATLIVRCGKCDTCLAARRRKWQARALIECSRSVRVWTGVLELHPDKHNYVRAKAAAAFEKVKKGGDFDALPHAVQFAKRHAVICQEITRYLKRIRKQSGAGLRFWLVTEEHTGGGKNHGYPHYHLLIHETGEAKITKAVLDDRWTWGFTHWRLVRETGKSVGYLCKYLSKTSACGIRASRGYGKIDLSHSELQTNVKTNDPPTFHCSKESESERRGKMGCTDPLGTGAVGQEGPNAIGREVAHAARREVGLQSQLQEFISMVESRRRQSDAMLGGPGRTQAFRQLAAKGTARRDPAYVSASKVTHALLGREPKPTGPFSAISDSEEADGPLPAFVLEGRSTPSKETEER